MKETLVVSAQRSMSVFENIPLDAFTSMGLATILLFFLMGGLASDVGLSDDQYRMSQALVGHRLSGLSEATISGCTALGAVCGSSIATTANIGRVALPSMIYRGDAANG